jgi:hypothetical protein
MADEKTNPYSADYDGVILILDDCPKRIRLLSKALAGKGTHLVLGPLSEGLREEAELITELASAGALIRVLATDEPQSAVKSIIDDFAHLDVLIIYSSATQPQDDLCLMAWLREALPYLKKGRPQGATVILTEKEPYDEGSIQKIRDAINAPASRPAIMTVQVDAALEISVARKISSLFHD